MIHKAYIQEVGKMSEEISFDKIVNEYGLSIMSELIKEKIVKVGDSRFLNLTTELWYIK